MTTIRHAYLDAAATTLALLRDPAVGARWDQPSALAEFAVSGLAGHLAAQVMGVPGVLATPLPDQPVAALIDHFTNATWIDTGIDSEANVRVRARGDAVAADGPVALVEQTAQALTEVRTALAAEPPDRVVHLVGRRSLTLDDYLVTRLLEIAVHNDDLAVSVDVPTPELPDAALDPVFALLTRLSVRRHGAPAVLRALARAERAPSTITAM